MDILLDYCEILWNVLRKNPVDDVMRDISRIKNYQRYNFH